jgi:leucine dehydrogenase
LPLDQLFTLVGGSSRIQFTWSEREGRLTPSDPALVDLAAQITTDRRDFDAHEAIFIERHAETGAVFGAFLHRTVRGQGAGGVRNLTYDSIGAFLTDGLRLSRGMGRKNALAGLHWGGGKGLIAREASSPIGDPAFRAELYRGYGRFITSLKGAYVTAEDVGTGPDDMAHVFETTRFTTCIPPEVGGSGNPSTFTARGVVVAMQAAAEQVGLGSLRGKTVAMQGIGHVGQAMISLLLDAGVARLIAVDVDANVCARIRSRFPDSRLDVRVVRPEDHDILAEACDVLAPNALGGVLNPDTIPGISATIICGAANNQLLDEDRDALALFESGVACVPDFLANRMGIVNCSNEQYGLLPDDPAILRHLGRDWEHSIHQTTQRVFARSRREGIPPFTAATRLADELLSEPHPLFGHRTAAIITALAASDWANSINSSAPRLRNG